LDQFDYSVPNLSPAIKIEGFEHDFYIETISSTGIYLDLLKTLFDFDLIKSLVSRKDFKFVYDGMSGVAGPYAKEIFHNQLGVPAENLFG